MMSRVREDWMMEVSIFNNSTCEEDKTSAVETPGEVGN